mmetsp:Transcript_42177/g.105316  ORF Transcript_42177/g.105316 Transcript_42177/m.105316 type:complete len:334 (+) Transcript_42177:116-1117(+)
MPSMQLTEQDRCSLRGYMPHLLNTPRRPPPSVVGCLHLGWDSWWVVLVQGSLAQVAGMRVRAARQVALEQQTPGRHDLSHKHVERRPSAQTQLTLDDVLVDEVCGQLPPRWVEVVRQGGPLGVTIRYQRRRLFECGFGVCGAVPDGPALLPQPTQGALDVIPLDQLYYLLGDDQHDSKGGGLLREDPGEVLVDDLNRLRYPPRTDGTPDALPDDDCLPEFPQRMLRHRQTRQRPGANATLTVTHTHRPLLVLINRTRTAAAACAGCRRRCCCCRCCRWLVCVIRLSSPVSGSVVVHACVSVDLLGGAVGEQGGAGGREGGGGGGVLHRHVGVG